MQYIRDIYAERKESGKPVISFEFFPFKTEKGEEIFWNRTLPELKALSPDFCSVTYGAGGGTRDKTLDIVEHIQNDFGIPAMAHLTCVCSTREQIGEILDDARERGIQNILALRGDPPGGTGEWQMTEGGFEYSYQLIEHLKARNCFSIGCAGFPEGHIACEDGKHADWGHLKKKVDCGAEFVLTQLFFDNADFYEFRDHMTGELGVEVPLVPGIIPVQSAKQIKRFTALCGARLPEAFAARLDELDEDEAAAAEFGVEYATEQCRDLLENGAPGIHFYTLNKARSAVRIMKNLGLA